MARRIPDADAGATGGAEGGAVTDERDAARESAAARAAAAKADKYFKDQEERLGDRPDGEASGKPDGAGRPRGAKGANGAKRARAGKAAPGPAPEDATAREARTALVRDALARLAQGDFDAFIALSDKDVGLPLEPESVGALKALSPADYARARARLKAETGVSLSMLDDLVRGPGAAASAPDSDGMVGRPVSYIAIEPWPEPVDGAELMTELSDGIGAYVIMDAHQRDAVALWAAFAHAHDFWDNAPLLIIVSPIKRCGKTKLQTVLARLVPRPQQTVNVSAALFPRLIEKHHPTLLVDEFDAAAAADSGAGEILRGLLNSSFTRVGAVVLKLVPAPGGDWDERQLSTWTAICIAGIGRIPDTVEDRSIIIRLIRKLVAERVGRLRQKDGAELEILRRKLARWVTDNEQALRLAAPTELDGLNDRQADAWEPIFAIADVAGGDWPARSRAAATALCAVDDAEAQDDDVKLVLLADIRDLFAKSSQEYLGHETGTAGRPDDGPRLTTNQLLEGLIALEERPWAAWGRSKKPITGMGLAALLRPYGVRSGTIRTSNNPRLAGTAKGYYLKAFEDAFSRYLPGFADPSRHTVTSVGKQGESTVFVDGTKSDCDGSENAGNPSNSRPCDGVTAAEAEKAGKEDNNALIGAVAAFAGRFLEVTIAPCDLAEAIGLPPDARLVARLKELLEPLSEQGVQVSFYETDIGDLITLRSGVA
jgi:hypothetical protein